MQPATNRTTVTTWTPTRSRNIYKNQTVERLLDFDIMWTLHCAFHRTYGKLFDLLYNWGEFSIPQHARPSCVLQIQLISILDRKQKRNVQKHLLKYLREHSPLVLDEYEKHHVLQDHWQFLSPLERFRCFCLPTIPYPLPETATQRE